MDDFNISSLKESRNEWCVRLMNILTPQIIIGIRSIFNSAKALCLENGEMDKYLLTFQNFLTRIPKWNNDLVQQEKDRICEASGCNYLEDLVTCVHIIQLKLLTSVRVGNKQKKVDLSIPKINDFIHKVYIHVARQMYNNAYLYSLQSAEVSPIDIQKNNHEIEKIVQKCIIDAVRESIPLEYILKTYLEETEEIVDEIKEEIIKETINPIKPEAPVKKSKTPPSSPSTPKPYFNGGAPKDVEGAMSAIDSGKSISSLLDEHVSIPSTSITISPPEIAPVVPSVPAPISTPAFFPENNDFGELLEEDLNLNSGNDDDGVLELNL